MKTTTLEGKVSLNPYGNWSDVDKGFYLGAETIDSVFREFKGKKIKVTIEELTDEE